MTTAVTPRDPGVLDHLHEHYRRLREAAPVHWQPGAEAWICTGYDVCLRVLRDPDTFTSDPRRVGVDIPDARIGLQALDPPDHGPLRQALVAAWRAPDQAASAARLRAAVRRRLAALPTDRVVDLAAELVSPMALDGICGHLGVPAPDAGWFTATTDRLFAGLDGGFAAGAAPDAARARAELSELVDGWLAAAPDGGVLGTLLAGTRPLGLPGHLIGNTLRAILVVGHVSVSRFLETLLLHCLTDRRVRAGLEAAAAAGESRTALEEMVRYDGPIQVESRFCTRDTVLGGQTVRAGQAVTLMIAAANRDPAVFDRPDEPVLDRRPNPHLGFGRGIHACVGASLAMTEATVLAEELLRTYPHATLAARAPRRMTGTFLGVAELPAWLSPGPEAFAALLPRGASSRAVVAARRAGASHPAAP
ncbi:cytochrome P450 [Dactylosporangium sp. NPDC000521]|uniref:cytochrome P450 n=1 Tax=Dactylosporangium sp. NPDC000521 TaxID=3363975 RepID=UPI0036CE0EA2